MNSQDLAVNAKELSKCYRIGLKESMDDSLVQSLIRFIKSPWKNYQRYRSLYRFDDIGQQGGSAGTQAADLIWALKGISFGIRHGETVGIIGGNGAGKSTLLKILSRITSPTTGYAEIRGRVSSLLEVGTGFHQELTGRENVYLNATILGMRKKEVDRKFDEIVEFSGVEKFIDTPVKRYSSGMKVRLAFSVAAHIEPDILIVDEVLAVGDAQFQRKCLHRMEEVGKQGRTVLFVSHNMSAVSRLCSRCILIEDGRIVQDGATPEVVKAYLASGSSSTACRLWHDSLKAPGNDIARLRAVRVRIEEGKITDTIDIRRPVIIEMEYDVLEDGFVIVPNFDFFNDEGIFVFKSLDQDPQWRGRPRPRGRYVSKTWIPGNFLSEGILFVTAALVATEPRFLPQCYERDVVSFQVVDKAAGDSVRGDYAGRIGGVVRPLLRWDTEYHQNGDGTVR